MVVLDSDIEVRVVLAFVVAMLLLKFGAQAQHLCYRFSQRSNEVDRHDHQLKDTMELKLSE